ncbi:BTAD domain-containing putative transcriptional regulator [Kitasatospora sp. NPDC002227]|uniref:AfsR/SARP family transcriptional regulator n=1 Tax=Kitasatospora sp. NPDC002227 TaxID=3154773 RepID=UPI003329E56E
MKFNILGPLELLAGPEARPVSPGATKLRVVLGTLLVHANQVVSAEDLIDELWPSAPPRTATTTLQVYISQLRKLLRTLDPVGSRDLVETRAPGYAVRASAATLDVLRFEELLLQGQQASGAGDFAAAAELCGQAAGLWRGSLLADLPPGLLLQQAGRRLAERRATALDERVRAELRLGRHRDLVAELQSLVAEHPVREEFHGHLMTAYYRSGRQAEALRVFGLLRSSLRAELGVEPGPRLRELHLRILRGDTALLRADGGEPARTAEHRAGDGESGSGPASAEAPRRPLGSRLPPADPLFTGRRTELAELERLLRPGVGGGAAVILSGAPGVGKTALAVQAAHRLGDLFPDGRVLVPAESAAPAPGWQAERRVLLILDGAAGPGRIRSLLPVPPGSALLVTSRRRLAGLTGPSGPAALRGLVLGVFAADDSRRLLTARGSQDQSDAAALDELASLCGHLPLAVRIAAELLTARPHWSPKWLARQLHTEAERLDWLRIGDLDLRGRFLTTSQQLGAAEQEVLGLLGLLPPGEFDLAMAAALLGADRPAALRAVEELVDASLLEAYRTPTGVAYRLPELLRLFAAGRLAETSAPGELAAAAERMCAAYLAAAGSAGELDAPVRAAALVRAARTAYQHDHWQYTVRLAEAAGPLLERDAAWTDWARTHRLALDAAERCADLAAQARLSRSLGDLAWQRRRSAEAREYYLRARALAQSVDAPEEYALTLVGLAQLELDEGRLSAAAELLGAALTAAAGPGHSRGRYEANRVLALLALAHDAPSAAAGHFAECLDLAGILRDRRLEAYARRSLRSLTGPTAAPGVELRPGVWRLPPSRPAGTATAASRRGGQR